MRRHWLASRATTVLMAAMLIVSGSATAANIITWTGAEGNWADASGWNAGRVPTSSDDARISSSSGPVHVTLPGAVCSPLTVSGVVCISDAGTLIASNQTIYRTVLQSGGTNTLSYLTLGQSSGEPALYDLSGGQLIGHTESIGSGGDGTFRQTGGLHTLPSPGNLLLGSSVGKHGVYELSGTGTLVCSGTVYVGYGGGGTFAQTGGTHTCTNLHLSYTTGLGGTYELGGTGLLTVSWETIGLVTSATFNQTGGTHSVGYLDLAAKGLYQLSGGLCQITSGLSMKGTLDFMGGAATWAVGGVVDLTAGAVRNASQASMTAAPGSLLLLRAGYDPTSLFRSFTTAGLVHVVGTPLVVPARQDIRGSGTLSDFVTCQGVLESSTGPGLNLRGGLRVSGTGDVSLSVGTLTCVGTGSGIQDSGHLAAQAEAIGSGGAGQFAQTGGVNECTQFYLGYTANSTGTYVLSGDAQLTTHTASVGYLANGTFTQTGGRHDCSSLAIGYTGVTGTYTLSGTGQLESGSVTVGVGRFIQTGGTHETGDLDVAYYGEATYELSESAVLTVQGPETVGLLKTGTFIHTGGSNTTSSLSVGQGAGVRGAYQLSGTAHVTAYSEQVGSFGIGTFTQTGGTNSVTTSLSLGVNLGSSGTYQLSGGLVAAGTESVGGSGSGTFCQSSGTNSTGLLSVGTRGIYQLSGGCLQASSGLTLAGTLDFANGSAMLTAGGIVDFSGGTLRNASAATLSIAANSLLIYRAGQDPQGVFGHYANEGLAHQLGTDLTVPAGAGLIGRGTINDFVDCQGTLSSGTGGSLSLNGGLSLSGTACVDLGKGALVCPGTTSGVRESAQLKAWNEYIASSGAGQYTQDGGSNEVALTCYVANGAGSTGTYVLSGGLLDAGNLDIGGSGTGRFVHTGGTNLTNIGLARDAGSSGSYELSGDAVLTNVQDTVGYRGVGTFTQTGGVHTTLADLSVSLYIGYLAGSHGFYALSGTGQVVQSHEYIGDSGVGTFTQTGGTHTVKGGMYLGYAAGSTGTYELGAGAQLTADSEYIAYSGTGTFNQTGGTNSVNYLRIGPKGLYRLGGGQIQVGAGLVLTGTLDFAGAAGSVMATSAIVDITGGRIVNASAASISLSADSLLLCRADFDPAMFGSYANAGLTHVPGTRLLVPAALGFAGAGTLSDFVDCQGVVRASTGKALNLPAGVSVSGDGLVDLGAGVLTCEGTSCGLAESALLTAGTQYVALSGTARFNHSGGAASVRYFYLGYNTGSDGTYCLSGGSLTVGSWSEYVGREGSGTFLQSGGRHEAGEIMLGWRTGSSGTYELSGGELIADTVIVGLSGAGPFLQTGGINRVNYLKVGGNNSFCSPYRLEGGQVIALSEQVGYTGLAVFTHSGGDNTTGRLYCDDGSTYDAAGPVSLTVQTLFIGYNKGGTFRISDPAARVSVTSSVRIAVGGMFDAVPGSMMHVSGTGMTNASTNPSNLAGLANLSLLVEGGPANVLSFEVAGRDLGPVAQGWIGNFVVGRLILGDDDSLAQGGTGSGSLRLVNANTNSAGLGAAEAMYVNDLVLNAGSTIDLNSLHLYYLVNGTPHTFTATLLPGDANLDGLVDQTDYTVWYNSYGATGGWSQGDYTGDRLVDQADYTIWYNNYGSSGGSVPEPATLSLLALGGLALLRRRVSTR